MIHAVNYVVYSKRETKSYKKAEEIVTKYIKQMKSKGLKPIDDHKSYWKS